MQYCLDALELFSLENKIDLTRLILDSNSNSDSNHSTLSHLFGTSFDTNIWQSKWRLFIQQLQLSTLSLKDSTLKEDVPQITKSEMSPPIAKEPDLSSQKRTLREDEKIVEPKKPPLPHKIRGSYNPPLPWALRSPKVSSEEEAKALPVETEEESIEDIYPVEELTDLDIFHLGLQIKHLPLHKLLENATKVVSTDAWDFARKEIQVLQMIVQFEAHRERVLTESAWEHNQMNCNIDAQSMNHGISMGTALHVRKGNSGNKSYSPIGSDVSPHDQLLMEIEWMSRDFMEERVWKQKMAKQIVDEIAKYIPLLNNDRLDHLDSSAFTLKPSLLKHTILYRTKKEEKLKSNQICVSLQNDDDVEYFTKDASSKEATDINDAFINLEQPYTRIHHQKYLKHIQQMQEQVLFSGKSSSQELLSGDSLSTSIDSNVRPFHHTIFQSPHINSPNASMHASIMDPFQAPWNPLEEEIIQVLVQLLSGSDNHDLNNVDDTGAVSVLRSEHDNKLPWSFITSYINTHCHKGGLIRSAASVEAHYLLSQRSARQRRTSGEGESSSTPQQPFGTGSSNLSSRASSASSTSIISFPRLSTAEDKRAWRVRQFEQLMLCFLTMKKRPRFKPALHQIAAANVAQILAKASSGINSGVSSAGGPGEMGISGTSSGPTSAPNQSFHEVDNPLISPAGSSTSGRISGTGSIYPPPPPAAIALLSNRKLNAAIHQSHEGAIKKGAYITGLTHKAYYSPTELALFKKARLQQIPPQPVTSLISGLGQTDISQSPSGPATSTGQALAFGAQQQSRPGASVNTSGPGLQHQLPGPSSTLVSGITTAPVSANPPNPSVAAMPTAATGIPAATPIPMPHPPLLRNVTGFSVSSASPSLSVTSNTTTSISGRASPSMNIGTGVSVGPGGFAPNPSMAFHPMLHQQHLQQQQQQHLQLRQGMPMAGNPSNFSGQNRATQQPGIMMLPQQQSQQQQQPQSTTGFSHHPLMNASGPTSKEYSEQQPQQPVNNLITHPPAANAHRSSFVSSNTDIIPPHNPPHPHQSSFTPLYYNSNPQVHLMQQQMQYMQQHNMNYMNASLSTTGNPAMQSGATTRAFNGMPNAANANPPNISLPAGPSSSAPNPAAGSSSTSASANL